MGTETQVGDFDDVDQLGAFSTDTRSFDTMQVSTAADAEAELDTFAANPDPGAWPALDRATIDGRLREIVRDSRVVKQGSLNLCGPAALLCMWAGRDPLAFAQFAIALFDTGSSAIGTLSIAPSDELLDTDPSTLPTNTEAADWMLLSAIRNTTSPFWQPEWLGDPAQELAGMTRPEELTEWLEATGCYGSVSNEANWATEAGVEHATGLTLAEGTDISLLINANLLKAARHVPVDSSFLLDMFPNHYVVALNSPTVAVADDPNGLFVTGDVLLSVWSWGRDTGNLDLAVPQADFVENYFGAVIARLA